MSLEQTARILVVVADVDSGGGDDAVDLSLPKCSEQSGQLRAHGRVDGPRVVDGADCHGPLPPGGQGLHGGEPGSRILLGVDEDIETEPLLPLDVPKGRGELDPSQRAQLPVGGGRRLSHGPHAVPPTGRSPRPQRPCWAS